uniref:NB-ARC domain-containing protein n=1 Tax=Oryza barthii TaxID=65489 RepID=A0A0D3HT49_9ORYZ
MYPEDYQIDRQDLIWRWIAEGFIVEVKNQTQEQVGENYFNELINRSLIQPVSIQYDGSAKYCRHWSSFKKIRRTWFPSNGTDNRIVKKITNNCSQVRSLLFFENPKPKQIPQFKKCHALRLKYLKVFGVNVTELPKDIGRLQQLETLTIHAGDVDEINIPSSVCRLQKLQRLNFNYPMRLPDEIGVLQALEVLYLNSIRYSIKCLQELCWLTRLRQLRILCPGIYDFGGDVARFQRYKEAFYFTLNELVVLQISKSFLLMAMEYLNFRIGWSPFVILPLFVSGILQALIRKWSSSLGIPKLLYLEVFLSRGLGDGLTVGCIACIGCCLNLELCPKLQRLCFSLYPREAASNLGLEQSYVHLSSLQHLTFYLCCTNATITDVKAVEAAIRNVISIHTRRPTLVLRRYLQDRMVKEDEEEQLKDSTDGCGVEEHHIQAAPEGG